MNRGLLEKALRETGSLTVGFGLLLFLFEVLVAFVLPEFFQDLSGSLLQVSIIRTFISGLLGTEVGDMLGPQMFAAIPWVHPVALAVVWAHVITVASRTPAGEVDRGTADVILGWPVSRWSWYVSESAIMVLSGLVVLLLGVLGFVLGTLLTPAGDLPPPTQIFMVMVNFYALYLAVGGIAMLASCCSSRRGRAVGVIFLVVLLSFLLNFLAQFWKPAQAVSWLSFLHFYRPIFVFRGLGWPVTDLATLGGVGLVAWLLGGIILARRDLHA